LGGNPLGRLGIGRLCNWCSQVPNYYSLSFIPMNLRKAERNDQKTIRRMVWNAQINPMQLDWRHFVLAIDEAGQVIGCVQVKSHCDGTRELASLVVEPEWQGRGIARLLIEHQLATNAPPLYLTCNSRLEPHYWRFGFSALALEAMSPYFRRLAGVMRFLMRLTRSPHSLSVMRWDGPAA
jgi:GNAT superfamily N-acetyltransferase